MSFIIIALAVFMFILTFIILFKYIRSKLDALEKEIRQRFSGEIFYLLDARANFAGQKSKGMGQMRGNGILVLMGKNLYFQMLMPKRELMIPSEKITGVSKANSFLTKSKGIPLLIVDFINEEGNPDSVGWWVGDTDGWIDSLTGVVKKNRESNLDEDNNEIYRADIS